MPSDICLGSFSSSCKNLVNGTPLAVPEINSTFRLVAVENSKTLYNLDFGENPGGTMLCVTEKQNPTLLPRSALYLVFATSMHVSPDTGDTPVYYSTCSVVCNITLQLVHCRHFSSVSSEKAWGEGKGQVSEWRHCLLHLKFKLPRLQKTSSLLLSLYSQQ